MQSSCGMVASADDDHTQHNFDEKMMHTCVKESEKSEETVSLSMLFSLTIIFYRIFNSHFTQTHKHSSIRLAFLLKIKIQTVTSANFVQIMIPNKSTN